MPKTVTNVVLNSMTVGVKASKVRVERGKLLVQTITAYSNIDRDRREARSREPTPPETPPPLPLMPYSLLEALREQVLEIACPHEDTRFLNGTLETSCLDQGQLAILACRGLSLTYPCRLAPSHQLRRARPRVCRVQAMGF